MRYDGVTAGGSDISGLVFDFRDDGGAISPIPHKVPPVIKCLPPLVYGPAPKSRENLKVFLMNPDFPPQLIECPRLFSGS